MRIVFRDEDGEVLASACDVKQNALAKCIASWRAFEICSELSFSFSKLIFEGDVVAVINRINKEGDDHSWMGHIIDDIK